MAVYLVPAVHANLTAALVAAQAAGDTAARIEDSRAPGAYAETMGSTYEALDGWYLQPQNAGIQLNLGASHLGLGNGSIVGTASFGYAINNTAAGNAAVKLDSWTKPKTARLINCQITRANAGAPTVLVVAQGGNTAALTLEDTDVEHTGGADAVHVSGSAVPTLTTEGSCTLGPAARGVELSAPSPVLGALGVHFDRCTSAGVASNAGAVAGTWGIRECTSDGVGAGPLLDWNTSASATLDVSANTAITAGSGIKRTSATNALGVIEDTWCDTMEYPNSAGGLTKRNNGYRVLALGGAGAGDVLTAADPGFVNMAGGNYDLLPTSTLVNVGVANGDLTDHAGSPRVSGGTQDIGAYELQQNDCGITGVVRNGANGLRVTFAASPAGPQVPLQASAETESNWTVAGTGGALTLTTATIYSALVYDLDLSRNILPGEVIEVDSSAVATDTGGLCDDPGTGEYVAPFLASRQPEDMLEAITGAMGDEIAKLVGVPETRLRLPLALNDTTVAVESTGEFPDAGTILVAGETIAYTARTHDQFDGCTRQDGREALYGDGLADRRIGTSVSLVDATWSSRDQVRGGWTAARGTGAMLYQVARARGLGKPLVQMTEADFANYLRVRHYLDAGPWWAVFRVLEAMLGFAEVSGSTGSAALDASGVWLNMPGVTYAETLLERFVWTRGRTRLNRVISARDDGAGGTDVLLTAFAGPLFHGHDLADGETGLDWVLLAFDLDWGGTYDSQAAGGMMLTAGIVLVRIYADAGISAPYAHLLAGTFSDVDSLLAAPPGAPGVGDRHLATATAGGWTIHNIYEWNGAAWVGEAPVANYSVTDLATADRYIYDGAAWVLDGVTAAGVILADETVAGDGDTWPLYLLHPFKAPVTNVLQEIVPAGVQVKVSELV